MSIRFKTAALMVFALSLAAVFGAPAASAAPVFTQEEKEWIRTAPPVRATITTGTAPLQFFDEKGLPAGVAVGWLDRVAEISGLKFTYSAGGSVKILQEKASSGETDIICSLPEQHAKRFKQFPMSDVFLTSRTVLVVNNKVDAENLAGKKYAAIQDSSLPRGIKPENAVYFPSRVNCLMAVDSGKADYCFSNEFSIAYYTVRKNFKHLTTIPLKHEPREYRLVYVKSDDMFVRVMNKAMASIPPQDMQGVILESMSKISPEISLSNIFEIYGVEIATFVFAVILLLITAFATRLLKKQKIETGALAERARRDSLTGLYNFAASKELISARLAEMGPEDAGSFLIMDIDKFKSINDNLGHYEGDQALMAFADALNATFRKSDIKGRLGGDEFCVFMDTANEEVVRGCCERLRDAITKTAVDRGKTMVTVSVGIATARKGGEFDELYKIADGALYDIKRAGGGNYCFARR